MPTDQHNYRSFLLRLWKVKNAGLESVRASVEDAQTHERHRFGDLETLFAFLREQADMTEIPPRNSIEKEFDGSR